MRILLVVTGLLPYILQIALFDLAFADYLAHFGGLMRANELVVVKVGERSGKSAILYVRRVVIL